jgi:hypothetical protein
LPTLVAPGELGRVAAILEKPQTAGSVPTFLRRARFHVQGLADPVERAATVPTLSASGEPAAHP